MNGEIQQKRRTSNPSGIVTITLLAFIAVMLATGSFFAYTLLGSERIYKGITIDGIQVEQMTRDELQSTLDKNFKSKLAGRKLKIAAGSNVSEFTYKDIDASFDIAGAAQQAYGIGRTGNVFERLYEISSAAFGGRNVNLGVIYSSEKVNALADEFYNKSLVKVKEPDVLVTDSSVTINSGHRGKSIDKAKLVKSLNDLIQKGSEANIEVSFTDTEPGKLNVDDLMASIVREPSDAQFKLENGNVSVIPHITGRSIDKSQLAEAVKTAGEKEDAVLTVPVVSTMPKVTTEMANANLFKDTLATFNTHFSTATETDKNRGENIRIAVSKINGKTLAPGEVFSFNDTVGPRTEEGGFKIAHTYVAGKIVDGIGGGICQVSTTLYNSVLLSDLEVFERHNHTFTVGYVPFGRDATVSYKDVDFKFRNNTNYPLRISAWVTAKNNIYFELRGTNENPGKTVTMTSKTIKTVDFTTKYTDDPTMPEGKTEVTQKGMKGYVVETYKTVKQDGKVVSQTKLHTSTYKPLEQEVKRGTKKADAPAPAAPAEITTEPEHSTGVDDADNPPAE